jgi:hypothetical protein
MFSSPAREVDGSGVDPTPDRRVAGAHAALDEDDPMNGIQDRPTDSNATATGKDPTRGLPPGDGRARRRMPFSVPSPSSSDTPARFARRWAVHHRNCPSIPLRRTEPTDEAPLITPRTGWVPLDVAWDRSPFFIGSPCSCPTIRDSASA